MGEGKRRPHPANGTFRLRIRKFAFSRTRAISTSPLCVLSLYRFGGLLPRVTTEPRVVRNNQKQRALTRETRKRQAQRKDARARGGNGQAATSPIGFLCLLSASVAHLVCLRRFSPLTGTEERRPSAQSGAIQRLMCIGLRPSAGLRPWGKSSGGPNKTGTGSIHGGWCSKCKSKVDTWRLTCLMSKT